MENESDLIDLESFIEILEEEIKSKSSITVEFKPDTPAILTLEQILSLYFRCDSEYTMSGDWFRGFKLLYQWLGPCQSWMPSFRINIHPRFATWEFQQLALILNVEYWQVHTKAQKILEGN